MSPSTMIEVLIHKSTGTALAWPLDFTDREYFALRVTDENDLRFGAFEPDAVDDLDGGPRYQPMRPRKNRPYTPKRIVHEQVFYPGYACFDGLIVPDRTEMETGYMESTSEIRAGRRNSGRKRRTYRDMN